MLMTKSFISSLIFFSVCFCQGLMNSYGVGHFYKYQGNLSSSNNLSQLCPSFKNKTSLNNPSTWHNLSFTVLSLSYSGNQNSQLNQNIRNGYSGLSKAQLIIPIKSLSSIGFEISPYIDSKYFGIDTSEIRYNTFSDTIQLRKNIERSGGIMNFNFSSSLKIIHSFNIGFRYNYLFGSSRKSRIYNVDDDVLINTYRSKYNGSFLELFSNFKFYKNTSIYLKLKKTIKPLNIDYYMKPMFNDVNGNGYYDGFDFPYLSGIKSDTVNITGLQKPFGYAIGLNLLRNQNHSISVEYSTDDNNLDFENDEINDQILSNNWIDNSTSLSFSYINFYDMSKTNFLNKFTKRFGLIYLTHSMKFSNILIEEYGASMGIGFNFKPLQNQIDFSYYLANRIYTNGDIKETVQQVQVGLSLADLWFVSRRKK